ncbi:MAG TPA: hypothetical protein VF111_09005, partial [Thermoanaerobaculia bacterium]
LEAGTRIELEPVPEWLSPLVAVLPAQQLAIGAAERLGRDVDRESVVDMLETFRAEQTGLTPAVTWTRNGHVGTGECTILRVDGRQLVPL